MKKLFISCPMRGRSEEAIKESMNKMHQIAEAVFGVSLDPIDSYNHEEPQATNKRIAYLGESIKLMADADYFIGTYSENDGCAVEGMVARRYNLKFFFVYEEVILSAGETTDSVGVSQCG